MKTTSTARTGRRPPVLWRLAGRVALVIASLILSLHVYALALRLVPAPGTILMMQRALQGQELQRSWVPLERISPSLVAAVIAAEDTQFCAHGGIDWQAIEAARAYNAANPEKRRRGGSTITQQTAKNIFFWNGGGLPRKMAEAWMSLFIEVAWGKRRIMEVYLNVAEWGDGIFGAEAASQARFGKPASELTRYEAALLASVLPSPNKWSATSPGPYVRARVRTVQARMRVVAQDGLAACVPGQ